MRATHFLPARTLTPAATLAVLIGAMLAAGPAMAQYSTIENRFTSLNDSFYERMGLGFGFSLNTGGPLGAGGGSRIIGIGPGGQPTPNGAINFGQGGFSTALPQFGGYQPNTGGSGGFGVIGGPGSMSFNWDFAQGNNRTNVTQAPVVTVPNGVPGFVSDATMMPFVISLIPVVGAGGSPYASPYGSPTGYGASPGSFGAMPRGGPSKVQQFLQSGQPLTLDHSHAAATDRSAAPRNRPPANPVDRRLAEAARSTAGQPAASVAAIRAQHAAADAAAREKALGYLRRGIEAEEAGKTGVAAIYYRAGLKQATGQLRQQLEGRLQAVRTSGP